MPVGDLVDLNYRYEFRGFVFGSGTPFQTEKVEGILGLPSARVSDDENQEGHGAHAGVDLLPGRTITITMNLISEGMNGSDALIDVATTAFQVSKRAAFIEYPFVTQRPEHSKRFCYARARRCEFASTYDTAHGLAVGAVQLFASDPRFYEMEETLTDITIADAGAAAQGHVYNYGNLLDGTMPILEITGPSTNPRIQNNGDFGRTIRIDVAVPIGQTLVIDTQRRTVFLNGVDRYDTVRSDNQWWVLPPADNLITYNRSGAGVSSRLRIKHHDAWTGA